MSQSSQYAKLRWIFDQLLEIFHEKNVSAHRYADALNICLVLEGIRPACLISDVDRTNVDEITKFLNEHSRMKTSESQYQDTNPPRFSLYIYPPNAKFKPNTSNAESLGYLCNAKEDFQDGTFLYILSVHPDPQQLRSAVLYGVKCRSLDSIVAAEYKRFESAVELTKALKLDCKLKLSFEGPVPSFRKLIEKNRNIV